MSAHDLRTDLDQAQRVTTPPEGNGDRPSPGSLLARLRAEREQIAATRSVKLAVPGYRNPELVAEYRLLDPKEDVEPIGQRVRKQFDSENDRTLYAAMDTLLAACQGLYVRAPGDKALEPLDPGGQGIMTFSQPRLADFFGFDHEEARDIVRGVFAGNDFAIVQHWFRLSEWMADTSIAVDGELLGEA